MRSFSEIVLLALVAQTHGKDVDTLVSRALKAGTEFESDLDDTTLAKESGSSGVTHSPEEVNTQGPTPNATLNKELQAQWAQKIQDGPHACTAADKEAIMKFPSGHADDSWGKIVSDCGHAGLNVFTGINQDESKQCLAKSVKLTDSCASCYTQMMEYDFENCKVQCLFSWCGEGCISCNHGSDVIGCIGFVDPQPTICSTSGTMDQLVQFVPSSVVSFSGIFMLGAFMCTGIIFSVLRFRRRSPEDDIIYLKM